MPGQPAGHPRIILELHESRAAKLAQYVEAHNIDIGTAAKAIDAGMLVQIAEIIDALPIRDVLVKYGSPKTRPLIRHHSITDQIRHRGSRALFDFFIIETTNIATQAEREKLCEELRALDGIVASAEFEPTYEAAKGPTKPKQPTATTTKSKVKRPSKTVPTVSEARLAPWEHEQRYLTPIGVTRQYSRHGAGVGLALLDLGWHLDHECLRDPVTGHPRKPAHVASPGLNQPMIDENHGTSALSVVLANPRSGKLRGIAFESTLNALILPDEPWDTIYMLVEEQYLRYGDVLLLELSLTGGLPLETERSWFRAIQYATSHGIVVVEVAGNGFLDAAKNRHGWNLDALTAQQARGWFTPDGALRDSGAIIVSACLTKTNRAGAHVPIVGSNYGSRVDCYAPGDGVLAASTQIGHDLTGYPKLKKYANTGDNDSYDGDFGQTSSASAIVAGVLLVTQSIARQVFEEMAPNTKVWPLSPQQIRRVLRDTVNRAGATVARHPDVPAEAQWSPRVVPDLREIAARIPQLPQIRIRADLADNLPPRQARQLDVNAQSPDIIVRLAPVPNYVAEYGPQSPTADLAPPSDTVKRGQPAFFYFRIKNIGDVHATNVRACAYWSRHADPAEPVLWQPLADIEHLDVPLESLIVTPPVQWLMPSNLGVEVNQIDILVIAGDETWDPRPELPLLKSARQVGRSRNDLLEFMLANRSVAWRTIDCS